MSFERGLMYLLLLNTPNLSITSPSTSFLISLALAHFGKCLENRGMRQENIIPFGKY